MTFDKFTIKSQEALQKSAEIATAQQQQAIEPGHILKAILETDENVSALPVQETEHQRYHSCKVQAGGTGINGYPKVSGPASLPIGGQQQCIATSRKRTARIQR
jgi:ATP-dependent Clp protease ATP-binding subunit ClpB